MVKLRRFYEAKQVGDIYHFCTLQVAVNYIIPNDTLSPSGKWTNSLIGSSDVLSFTRDKRFIVDLLSYEKILVRFDVDGNKLSENHKIFRVGLALLTRFERVAFRLGVIPSVSYRVVRDASQYPQTRINTGFSQDRCAAA